MDARFSNLSPSVATATRKDMQESGDSEYLAYDGSALDVVTIAMPEPPSDESMSGFTDLNRESGTHETDLGNFRYGPRRIERTAEGNLVIRPRSQAVDHLADWFAAKYQNRFEGRQQIAGTVRFQARWGIFHDPYELWEVEFAYHKPDYMEQPRRF